jgi:hypothetical protein
MGASRVMMYDCYQKGDHHLLDNDQGRHQLDQYSKEHRLMKKFDEINVEYSNLTIFVLIMVVHRIDVQYEIELLIRLNRLTLRRKKKKLQVSNK